MKSKIRASRIRAPTARRAESILAVFHDDAFEHIGDVLTLVSRFLELVEKLLELHQPDRILLVLKELAYGQLMHAIGFVLEAIDLDDVRRDGDLLVERPDGGLDGLGRGGQQLADRARA